MVHDRKKEVRIEGGAGVNLEEAMKKQETGRTHWLSRHCDLFSASGRGSNSRERGIAGIVSL